MSFKNGEKYNYQFSVLLSIYFKENAGYFEECLSSIFNQTCIPSEVVIVKDGVLPENLEVVIDKYNAMYTNTIKSLQLEKNYGLGIALAKGLELCSNEIVARMDTDDIAVKTRFEEQLNYLNRNAEIVLIGTQIDEFIDNTNNIVGEKKVPLTHEEIVKYAKTRNPFNHMTVMFKKSHILEVGNYQKLIDIGYEDYYLWIRLIMANKKTANLENTLVHMRVGKEMYKRRGDKKRLKTALFFRKTLYKIGFISYFRYIRDSLLSILFSIIPPKVRKIVYMMTLRKRIEK